MQSEHIPLSKRTGVGRGGKWHVITQTNTTLCDGISPHSAPVDTTRIETHPVDAIQQFAHTTPFCKLCCRQLIHRQIINPPVFFKDSRQDSTSHPTRGR